MSLAVIAVSSQNAVFNTYIRSFGSSVCAFFLCCVDKARCRYGISRKQKKDSNKNDGTVFFLSLSSFLLFAY